MFDKRKPLLLLLIGSLFLTAFALVERDRSKSSQRLQKSQTIGDVKYLQVNNLSIPMQNNGDIATPGDPLPGPLHGPGGEFPAGSDLGFLFASDFFISGFVDGELWTSAVAAASRVLDYTEGPVGGDRADAKAKIYVVTSPDESGSSAYAEWADAVSLGADYVDVDGNGAYDPNVDRPDLLGDQMLWFVINDGANLGQRRWAGGRIVGMEIHVTA